MMKRSLWIVLLAVLLLTLPAGCGGAPDQPGPDSGAAPPVSPVEDSAEPGRPAAPPGRRTEPGSGGAPACGEQAVGDAGEP